MKTKDPAGSSGGGIGPHRCNNQLPALYLVALPNQPASRLLSEINATLIRSFTAFPTTAPILENH